MYWLSKPSLERFALPRAGDLFTLKKGMSIGNNARFLRLWHEVNFSDAEFSAKSTDDTLERKWYPCINGGQFRKWFGNHEYVTEWQNDGAEIKSENTQRTGNHWSRHINSTEYFFHDGMNWSDISSASFSARRHQNGFAFTSISMAAFSERDDIDSLLAMSNSVVGTHFLTALCPTYLTLWNR